jgi:hypothetical protein
MAGNFGPAMLAAATEGYSAPPSEESVINLHASCRNLAYSSSRCSIVF